MRLRAAFGLAVPVALAALAATAGAATGDRELGEYLFGECTACHQASGHQTGAIPAIIGLPEEHFVEAMQAYRSGERESTVMRALAARLTAEEIAALASYLGSLSRQP